MLKFLPTTTPRCLPWEDACDRAVILGKAALPSDVDSVGYCHCKQSSKVASTSGRRARDMTWKLRTRHSAIGTCPRLLVAGVHALGTARVLKEHTCVVKHSVREVKTI